MPLDQATRTLQDTAALRSIGAVSPQAVVQCACDTLIALAAQAVSGSLTPRELAAAIHQHFGHSMPLAERLAALDDEYDLGAYATMTREQIDQEVIAEARRLTHEQADQQTAHNDQ